MVVCRAKSPHRWSCSGSASFPGPAFHTLHSDRSGLSRGLPVDGRGLTKLGPACTPLLPRSYPFTLRWSSTVASTVFVERLTVPDGCKSSPASVPAGRCWAAEIPTDVAGRPMPDDSKESLEVFATIRVRAAEAPTHSTWRSLRESAMVSSELPERLPLCSTGPPEGSSSTRGTSCDELSVVFALCKAGLDPYGSVFWSTCVYD